MEVCSGYGGYASTIQAVNKAAITIKARDKNFKASIQLPYLTNMIVEQPDKILSSDPPQLTKSDEYKKRQNKRKNYLAKMRNKRNKEKNQNQNQNENS